MPKWTTGDIPDLAGKRAIVTGANSGLGLQTALELARHGATVVLACRSAERGEKALATHPRRRRRTATSSLGSLDLADLASVRAFAEAHDGAPRPAGQQRRRDGAAAPDHGGRLRDAVRHQPPRPLRADRPAPARPARTPRRAGRDRHEHDALAGRHRLRRPRRRARLPPVARVLPGQAGQPRLHQGARPQGAVRQRRVAPGLRLHQPAAGRPAHGAAARHARACSAWANRLVAQSDAAGAWPSLYAATAEVEGGQCYGPRGPGQSRGAPTRVRTLGRAADPELGRRLWEVSEERTGVSYGTLHGGRAGTRLRARCRGPSRGWRGWRPPG